MTTVVIDETASIMNHLKERKTVYKYVSQYLKLQKELELNREGKRAHNYSLSTLEGVCFEGVTPALRCKLDTACLITPSVSTEQAEDTCWEILAQLSAV